MLFIGDYTCIPYNEPMIILNLTGLVEGYQRVNLVPQSGYQLDFTDDNNFDIEYYQYIFSNQQPFIELMKIIMPLYEGNDVFLLVSRGVDSFDKFTESLIKIIEARYGYTGVMILNDPSDYPDTFDRAKIMDEFSIPGLNCLDQDKEKYTFMIESMKQQT